MMSTGGKGSGVKGKGREGREGRGRGEGRKGCILRGEKTAKTQTTQI